MTGEVQTMVVNPAPVTDIVKPEKAKATKVSKARNPASHPTFYEMISDAIVALKERTGSSQYAITKFIEEKHKKLPANFRKLLLVQLKKLVASGKLTKVKASYKLSIVTKSAVAAKPAAKKPKSVAAKVTTAKAAVSKVAKISTKTKAVAKPKPKAKGAAKAKSAPVKTKAKSKAEEGPAKVAKTSAKTTPGKKVAEKVKTVNKAKVVKKAAVVLKSTTVKKLKTVKSPAKKKTLSRKAKK